MARKGKGHLLLFPFLLLFFSTHATLHLNPLHSKALSAFLKDLGVNGQPQEKTRATNHPCDTEGIFCERRLSKSNNESYYFLRITRLVFNSKHLNGVLSPAIGHLTELKELSLPNNNLFDRIPPQIVGCRKLEILDLSNNLFSGQVPSQLSSLIHLRILDVSSNKLSGNLNFLRYFPNLESLSIANNLFTGRLPASIRSFHNLRHFNFSGNCFLEDSLLLNERLQSESDTAFKRYAFAESSNGGGRNSAPALAPSKSHKKISTVAASAASPGTAVPHHKHKSRKRRLARLILGIVAGALALAIFGFIFSLRFNLPFIKRRGKELGPAIFSPLIKKVEDLDFLKKEDGLASLEIIGRGGCGVVYKAELPGSNGKMIAIKKITQPSNHAVELAEGYRKLLNMKMRQIRAEINTVGQIRHRNLLPLLAHVSRPDCHCLVYEFMKNGSLQDVLDKVKLGERELDWLSRHKFALGIANGLEYLHLCHRPCIIHRDIKPANILLDDDMEARITDFGLAKAMPEAHTHIRTLHVAGTAGYIAPECRRIPKFTDKSDVYSFGIVLAVLVTGKVPSDEFFQHTGNMSLVKWMRKVMSSENPKEAIDAKLMGKGYEEQMLLVLKIACFCTMDDPKERPNSKDVRCMLSQIKH